MKDKIIHIIAGAGVAAICGLPCYLETLSLFAGLWVAIFATAIVGAVKEFCDAWYCLDPTTWDWRDIGFTVLGALIVALFIIGLHFCKG